MDVALEAGAGPGHAKTLNDPPDEQRLADGALLGHSLLQSVQNQTAILRL